MSADERELDLANGSISACFGQGYFNLIRRGADGSLTLSADHWRLDQISPGALIFSAREPEASELVVNPADVERVVWDRLPRQQARSQIRFFLTNGDVWTVSGSVDESALPARS
jgi:hypothetical protein